MLSPTYGGGAQTDSILAAPSSGSSSHSAVSWPAVFAGALIATMVTLLLSALGTGIGLSSFSVGSGGDNPSATTFTVMAAVWLIVVQWVSAAFGGYLTGRMRTRWVSVHTDEVFFRDTANGFLTWALSSLIVVGFASSALTSAISGAAHMAGHVAAGAAQGVGSAGSTDGIMDSLLRPAMPSANGSPQDARAEIGRILAADASTGSIAPEDRSYLAQVVAARAGISEPDAEKRVDAAIAKQNEAVAKAKQAAEASRKATAHFMFYTFLSMLIGAFVAAAAAALGGLERDSDKPHV